MAEKPRVVSVPTDTMSEEAEEDELVRRASIPSLATLYDRGKKSGLIKPVNGYGGQPPA